MTIVTTEIVSDEQLVEMLATAWDAGFSRGYDAATDDEAGARRTNPYRAMVIGKPQTDR